MGGGQDLERGEADCDSSGVGLETPIQSQHPGPYLCSAGNKEVQSICLPSALVLEQPRGAGACRSHPVVCPTVTSCFLLLRLHLVIVLKAYKPPGRKSIQAGQCRWINGKAGLCSPLEVRKSGLGAMETVVRVLRSEGTRSLRPFQEWRTLQI